MDFANQTEIDPRTSLILNLTVNTRFPCRCFTSGIPIIGARGARLLNAMNRHSLLGNRFLNMPVHRLRFGAGKLFPL